MSIKIYTDGSCLNNQLKNNYGGWAYIIILEDKPIIKKSGCEINTTNQRMELMACIEAMKHALTLDEKEIEIFTDSAYIFNCVKDGWYLKWINNGWHNSKGNAVKNQDLWKIFVALLEMQYFKFTHIYAHNGEKWNEIVDSLAKRAAKGEV
jgi:ribonuclease HI